MCPPAAPRIHLIYNRPSPRRVGYGRSTPGSAPGVNPVRCRVHGGLHSTRSQLRPHRLHAPAQRRPHHPCRRCRDHRARRSDGGLAANPLAAPGATHRLAPGVAGARLGFSPRHGFRLRVDPLYRSDPGDNPRIGRGDTDGRLGRCPPHALLAWSRGPLHLRCPLVSKGPSQPRMAPPQRASNRTRRRWPADDRWGPLRHRPVEPDLSPPPADLRPAGLAANLDGSPR